MVLGLEGNGYLSSMKLNGIGIRDRKLTGSQNIELQEKKGKTKQEKKKENHTKRCIENIW